MKYTSGRVVFAWSPHHGILLWLSGSCSLTAHLAIIELEVVTQGGGWALKSEGKIFFLLMYLFYPMQTPGSEVAGLYIVCGLALKYLKKSSCLYIQKNVFPLQAMVLLTI